MANVPNYVIQQLASGAVIPGLLPLIGTNAPDLNAGVIKQLRGRTWTYKLIDSASGGLFESPVGLANRLQTQLHTLPLSRDRTRRRQVEKGNLPDRVGYSVKRLTFSGASTTALVGQVVNPFGTTASIAGEVLTVSPSPNGAIKEFTAPLANGNVMYETFKVVAQSVIATEAMVAAPAFNGVLTVFTFPALANLPIAKGTLVLTTSAGAGSENFTDNGDGTLTGSGGGTGTINYVTGVVGATYAAAPAGGLTVSGAYGFGSGFSAILLDRGDERLAFIDKNGSIKDAGTIDYRISPVTGVATVRMRFETAPPAGSVFTAQYDHGTASAAYTFFDTGLVSGIDPASFNVGIPVTGSNAVVVPPGWHLIFTTAGALSAVGSLGVMYGEGMGQPYGQELPGFGT